MDNALAQQSHIMVPVSFQILRQFGIKKGIIRVHFKILI